MARLIDEQIKFAGMLGDLLHWCRENGYAVTIGETWRDPARAAPGSFHPRRLAVDLNLFVDGVYRRDTDAYAALGAYWKSIGGTWGGDFKSPDGNHFSLGE